MFRVVRWQGRNIFDVLKLEEALFRDTDKNWVVIGKGTPRSIVMGPTGVANQLLNTEMAVIRRFTGGGTVIVDEQTVFVSLIGGIDWITQKAFANNFQFFPRPLLEWSSSFYQPVFNRPDFALNDVDYVLGDKKFGGNAQAISRNRFVHHTSFLWDFEPANMGYLQNPAKQPEYRRGRSHLDFLTTIHRLFGTYDNFEDLVLSQVDYTASLRGQTLEEESFNAVLPLVDTAPRISSRYVELD